MACEDYGHIFGALLVGRIPPNTYYTVTGPEAVTDCELFEYMNSVSGYKAEFVDIADDELAA